MGSFPPRDCAFETAVMSIADIFESLEGWSEVGVPVSRQDSVAVGQVHIGDPFAAAANGFRDIGLLNAHMKEVGHDGYTRTVDGVADFQPIRERTRPPLLVPVERFDNDAAPAGFGVRGDIVRENVGEQAGFHLRGGGKRGEIRNSMTTLKLYSDQRREYDADAAKVAAQCERVFQVLRRLPPSVSLASNSPMVPRIEKMLGVTPFSADA